MLVDSFNKIDTDRLLQDNRGMKENQAINGFL
jgi:hypothetical protein